MILSKTTSRIPRDNQQSQFLRVCFAVVIVCLSASAVFSQPDSTPGTQPRPLGIYLQGYNERPPADNAVVHGNSDVMVIEGNTEDVPDAKDDSQQDLKVVYDNGTLSVKAKKEPLVVVLYAIANELGIPLEVRNEVTEPVTV